MADIEASGEKEPLPKEMTFHEGVRQFLDYDREHLYHSFRSHSRSGFYDGREAIATANHYLGTRFKTITDPELKNAVKEAFLGGYACRASEEEVSKLEAIHQLEAPSAIPPAEAA